MVFLALMESLRVLKAVMNLNSSMEQSCKFLCLALPFCWIQEGETWRTGIPWTLGSTRTPIASSSSHFACCRTGLLHDYNLQSNWCQRHGGSSC